MRPGYRGPETEAEFVAEVRGAGALSNRSEILIEMTEFLNDTQAQPTIKLMLFPSGFRCEIIECSGERRSVVGMGRSIGEAWIHAYEKITQ